MVTNNIREFKRIDGLEVEDLSQQPIGDVGGK